MNTNKQTGDTTMNESYKDKFNATMKKFGIDSLGDLKSDEEKKKFFKAVDKSHDAVNESVTEELLAIAEETVNEMMNKEMMTAMKEMMKEMSSKMEMLKAEVDPTKVEMMKKEMMTAMKKMPEMAEMSEMMKSEMMKEMMKKMDEYGSMNAMKEAVSPAQQAAIAISKKEKEEKHTPSHKETAVNAMAMNAMKKETAKKEMMKMAMKMPIQSMYGKMNAMKTGDDDLTPMNNMKLNAMIKDPHKSKGDDPKKDMNATYMKSDVRGDVKNGGGTDMSKVNDKPQMQTAMKKINAMYKTEKYLDEKPGSIQNVVAEMYQTGKLKG